MGLLWVFLGMGAVVMGVTAFESGVMRSPKAPGFTGVDVADFIIEAVIESILRQR